IVVPSERLHEPSNEDGQHDEREVRHREARDNHQHRTPEGPHERQVGTDSRMPDRRPRTGFLDITARGSGRLPPRPGYDLTGHAHSRMMTAARPTPHPIFCQVGHARGWAWIRPVPAALGDKPGTRPPNTARKHPERQGTPTADAALGIAATPAGALPAAPRWDMDRLGVVEESLRSPNGGAAGAGSGDQACARAISFAVPPDAAPRRSARPSKIPEGRGLECLGNAGSA